MKPSLHLLLIACLSTLIGLGHSLQAESNLYQITPRGSYTYRPSPESLGVVGCNPNDFRCEFAIEGTLVRNVDRAAQIARIEQPQLTLLGNESIQQTGGRAFISDLGIQAWLAERTFDDQHVLGPFTEYAARDFSELRLIDTNDGHLELTGGFDLTPADGDALHIHFHAMAVPEPAINLTILMGLTAWSLRRAIQRGSCHERKNSGQWAKIEVRTSLTQPSLRSAATKSNLLLQ